MSENCMNRFDLIENFVSFRKNSNWWNDSYDSNLKAFSRFCSSTFPDCDLLTQQMVDSWTEPRDSESIVSYRARIQVIVTFIKYLLERNMTSVVPPELPRRQPHKYIPHSFSKAELSRFFNHCDQLIREAGSKEKAMDALTTSVIFRLLYSSGLRTIEARLLRSEDVDLNNGVLSIRNSKGQHQHFVVLDDEVCKMLSLYDSHAARHFPGRTYFFTRHRKGTISPRDLRYMFAKSWDAVNNAHAVPYDLRHNYATTNINSWLDEGFEFYDKMLYLSKSMGHSTIESTQYYYSLVPRLASIIYECSNDSFEELVPEVIPYED